MATGRSVSVGIVWIVGIWLAAAPMANASDLGASGQATPAAGPFAACEICWTDTSGVAFCGQDLFCSDAVDCANDADCPAGSRCAADTCCGPDPICITTADCTSCTNPGVCGTYAACLVPDCESINDFPVCATDDCPAGLECAADPASGDCRCLAPMLIDLDYLRATESRRGVTVSWRTLREVETMGFRIVRETGQGSRKTVEVLTPQVVSPRGSEISGATYEVLDETPGHSGRTVYWLEEIDSSGQIARYGPVSPQAASRTPTSRRR